MSADFRKVRPGQPLRITAKAWNRVLDTVATQPGFAGSAGLYDRPCHLVQIKNTTGSTVPKWGVLEITGIVNDPTAGASSLAQFQDVPILEGSTPSDTTAGKFVVAVEPIAAGKFGRAAIDGVVQVKLNVISESHQFAKPATTTSNLDTAGSGDASILWKESGTGTNKWGLVRLASGGHSIKRGTFAAPWNKGSTKTVDEILGSVSYTNVKNYFATIAGTGSKACAIAYVGDEWILIAAECG